MALGKDERGVGVDEWIVHVGEGAENRTEDHLGAESGDRHADLPPDFFLGTSEDEVAWEGLERRAFRIRERAVFPPVVHMRAATARACEGVGWAIGIKSLVDVAHPGGLAVELDLGDFRADRCR